MNSESLGSTSFLSLGKNNPNNDFWDVTGLSEIRYIQCLAFSRLKICMFLLFYNIFIIDY